MWLMKHKGHSKATAYDMARREFYQHRHLSEIRARVAKEEALHVGAYFGKGPLEIGMELEDKSWEQAVRAQMFSGAQDEPGEGADMTAGEYDLAIEELVDTGTTPNTPQSKVVPGGVPIHP
jgi:small subunit ribosomal protein S23